MKTVMVMVFSLVIAGFAVAAAPVHNHGPSPMMKQHQAMSETNRHWQICKKCLENGDWGAAEAALVQMRKSLADLEKFKPHKNATRITVFREASRTLQGNAAKLAETLAARDSSAVPGVVTMIEQDCRNCHGSFR